MENLKKDHSSDLQGKALSVTHKYFEDALRAIRIEFGEDQAGQHQELIGAYMKTCAINAHSLILAASTQDASSDIEDSLHQLSFDSEICTSLQTIADMLEKQ